MKVAVIHKRFWNKQARPALLKMTVFESRWYTCKQGIFVNYDKNSPPCLVWNSETEGVLCHELVRFIIKRVVERQTWKCVMTFMRRDLNSPYQTPKRLWTNQNPRFGFMQWRKTISWGKHYINHTAERQKLQWGTGGFTQWKPIQVILKRTRPALLQKGYSCSWKRLQGDFFYHCKYDISMYLNAAGNRMWLNLHKDVKAAYLHAPIDWVWHRWNTSLQTEVSPI